MSLLKILANFTNWCLSWQHSLHSGNPQIEEKLQCRSGDNNVLDRDKNGLVGKIGLARIFWIQPLAEWKFVARLKVLVCVRTVDKISQAICYFTSSLQCKTTKPSHQGWTKTFICFFNVFIFYTVRYSLSRNLSDLIFTSVSGESRHGSGNCSSKGRYSNKLRREPLSTQESCGACSQVSLHQWSYIGW